MEHRHENRNSRQTHPKGILFGLTHPSASTQQRTTIMMSARLVVNIHHTESL
jgi:hypothetical protein